jgi:lysophospholipase L1-like esterase
MTRPRRAAAMVVVFVAACAATIWWLALASVSVVHAVPATKPAESRTHPSTEPTSDARSSAPADEGTWCILPLGDSLTAGVGVHGSYRDPLMKLLRAAHANGSVATAGTQRHPCTPKRPDVPYRNGPSDVGAAHEGHCNWDSRALLGHWQTLRRVCDARATTAACSECRFGTALMMLGHNDVFRVARSCKVREGCAADLRSAEVTCATTILHQDFKQNALALGRSVLDAATGHRPSRDGSAGPSLVLGLNPPTGFPCLDSVLHMLLREIAQELRIADVKKEGRPHAVALASFPRFERGVHAFDSTHPNKEGNALLARGWAVALLGHPSAL